MRLDGAVVEPGGPQTFVCGDFVDVAVLDRAGAGAEVAGDGIYYKVNHASAAVARWVLPDARVEAFLLQIC